jgi:hypothetical protein
VERRCLKERGPLLEACVWPNAKVEARGHAPGVGRIVIVTVTPREVRP